MGFCPSEPGLQGNSAFFCSVCAQCRATCLSLVIASCGVKGQGTVSLFHMETQLFPLPVQGSAIMFKQGENRPRKGTCPSKLRLKLLWARSEKRKGKKHGHGFLLWYSTSYMIFASCHFIQQRPLSGKSHCYSNTCCKTVL